MRLVLASFFQEENHGHGRKIGICPKKPDSEESVPCDLKFVALDPGDLYWNYHKQKHSDPDQAGKQFVSAYREKLQHFVEDVRKTASEQGKTVLEVLPFKEGDTLLSWEKKGNTSYRAITAEYLRQLGYDVEES